MKGKIAIYTCITKSYDTLEQPCTPPEGFDFIQFVPRGAKKQEYNGIWRIEELPVSWEDPIITSRFPKLSPQTVLEDYEYSLWIDGNIRIANRAVYEKCLELAASGVKYAGIKHPTRDCAYEECERVLKDDREKLWQLLHVVKVLKKSNFPRHFGLMENGVIFRKHNDPEVIEFDRLWQERFVLHSPKRDQLVHSWCLRDVTDLKVDYLLPEGINAMNTSLFDYKRHPSPDMTYLQRKWKYGRLWPARWILHLYLMTVK